MEYPHRRYIRFLISKRLQGFEIVSECMVRTLLAPNEDDVYELANELGVFPKTWAPRFDASNKEFKQWLMDNDVYELWNPDREVQDAIHFLQNERVRKSFESLILLHGDVEIAKGELLNTYPAHWVPSLGVLEVFCHLFYDIGDMSKGGLFQFIKTLQDEDIKIAAFGGELEYTYARLGLRQRIQGTDFLDSFLQVAQLSNINHLRAGGIHNAAAAAGHAALGRAAMDALALREEFSTNDGASTMRKDAALFKTEVVKRRASAIISIDDLRGDVIDAEPTFQLEETVEGGGASIHRLPTGGRPRTKY